MENNFKKERHNPIELMKLWWPYTDLSHIDYDPAMKKGEYNIIRQSGGDGTAIFTIQMLQETLLPIVNKQSFFIPKEPSDWSKVKNLRYKIGPMLHATCFGMINLKCSKDRKYPGLRERVRMPVCSYFIYT
jgi:hypothetical protein